MGREIHWQVEYQVESTRSWYLVHPTSKYERFIYDWRDSLMFDLLAGAGRKAKEPVFAARGLPKDMSTDLKHRYELKKNGIAYQRTQVLGDHTHSWLNYTELEEVCVAWRRARPEGVQDLVHTVMPCLIRLLVELPMEQDSRVILTGSQLRAVFGFSD
jgi:hypothetical protein